MRRFEKTIDGICSSEGSTDQDDLLRVETCDKETNTSQMRYLPILSASSARSQDASGRRHQNAHCIPKHAQILRCN